MNVCPLRFVASSLGLDVDRVMIKTNYIDGLIAWVSVESAQHHVLHTYLFWQRYTQRLTDPEFNPKAINLSGLKFIQRVIAKTVTPSWINSVPSNYGEANAGSIKAGEWRTLATIYIPIALMLLWGDQPKYEVERLGAMLAQSMALFQAVTLVCRYTASKDRADLPPLPQTMGGRNEFNSPPHR
jgi:hypothetical protein